tara:strand:+ start:567 stop:809 length:243 start_codon:yes stop_codon:yes gene_type:complete
MKVKVLIFGIIADLIGESSIIIELKEASYIRDLKQQLIAAYPQVKNYTNFAVALNEEYALDTTKIKAKDVIAIIPPVSGG